MVRHAVTWLLAVLALLATPSTAFAQSGTTTPLSELLPQLYQRVIDAGYQTFAGFTSAVDEDIRFARLDTAFHVNNLLADQLSSFPLGSSAGGFTWTFEPVSGTFNRASDSFGPIFAERALTIGRNKLNFGVNYQRVTFDHLDGKKLRGGEIVGYTGLATYLGPTTGIFFADALDLIATTDTVSVFSTYGISDRLDVGVAVPINRVSVKASLTSRTGTSLPPDSTYVVPDLNAIPPAVEERSGTASGIGDLVVRAKYTFVRRGGGGLAGAADVRLPTGDERNLLGIAGAQTKVYLVASTAVSKLSPHVNIGYTVSGESGAARDPKSNLIAPPDEVNYAGGADVALSLRTTVAVDVVGRTLRKVGTLEEAATVFGSRFQEFRLRSGADLHLLLGSTGIKLNPVANLLVSANVLFPLSSRGLTDNLTWLLGFDYSF